MSAQDAARGAWAASSRLVAVAVPAGVWWRVTREGAEVWCVQTRALLYLATLSSSLTEALVAAEEAVAALAGNPAASELTNFTTPSPSASKLAAKSRAASGSSSVPAATVAAAAENGSPANDSRGSKQPAAQVDMRQRRQQATAEEQERLIAQGGGALQVFHAVKTTLLRFAMFGRFARRRERTGCWLS